MEFKKVLEMRQSTRKFLDKQIREEELEAILRAGNQAPIGSALYEDIHITVVQDQEILLKLCEAAWERFSSKEKIKEIAEKVMDKTPEPSDKKRPNLFYDAPTVIFVSNRKQTIQPGIEFANVSTVITQMHLQAIDLGLGSCYMWGALESMRMLPEFDHTDLLQIPDGFEPLMALAVGYPERELEAKELHADRIAMNRI